MGLGLGLGPGLGLGQSSLATSVEVCRERAIGGCPPASTGDQVSVSMSSACTSLKVPLSLAPSTYSLSPASVVVWREPATGGLPLTAALDQFMLSVSKMCRSARERRPSCPPNM